MPGMALETLSLNGLLKNASFATDPDGSAFRMLLTGCRSSSKTLPVITICDSFGRIVYFSQGYNTSLASDLQSVISQLLPPADSAKRRASGHFYRSGHLFRCGYA